MIADIAGNRIKELERELAAAKDDIENAARYSCGICGVCTHHDKMWVGSGCNLTKNGEQCTFERRGAREGEGK